MSNICEGYETAKKRAEDRCLWCVAVMGVSDLLNSRIPVVGVLLLFNVYLLLIVIFSLFVTVTDTVNCLNSKFVLIFAIVAPSAEFRNIPHQNFRKLYVHEIPQSAFRKIYPPSARNRVRFKVRVSIIFRDPSYAQRNRPIAQISRLRYHAITAVHLIHTIMYSLFQRHFPQLSLITNVR